MVNATEQPRLSRMGLFVWHERSDLAISVCIKRDSGGWLESCSKRIVVGRQPSALPLNTHGSFSATGTRHARIPACVAAHDRCLMHRDDGDDESLTLTAGYEDQKVMKHGSSAWSFFTGLGL